MDEGIDPFKQLIPVVPASHYLMGGIVVDKDGQSSIKKSICSRRMYNSGLPGKIVLVLIHFWKVLVYAHNAAMKSVELFHKDEFNYFDLETCQNGMKRHESNGRKKCSSLISENNFKK